MRQDPLLKRLKRIRRRLVAVRAVEAGLAGAIGGSALAAVVTVMRVLRPQELPLASVHPWFPIALVALGFAAALLGRLFAGATLRDAALAADRAAGLKERLATALEVLESAPSGLLDDRLVTQAREAAEALDVGRLPLATTLWRRVRIALVAVLVLVAAVFVPSIGGPPVAPQAADRAAGALEALEARGALAPAVREALERTIAGLRQGGMRRGGAERLTSAVYQAAARAERARHDTLAALAQVEGADIERLVRAAAKGDATAAAGAAADLAGRLGSEPGSIGMPGEQRERLADGLSGAAARADDGALADLAATLRAAADAVRTSAPDTGETLGRLAAAMTDALDDRAAGAVAALVDAVGQARRTLGLGDAAASSASTVADAGAGAAPERVGRASAGPAGATQGGGPGERPTAVPAGVRPEDRDAVRRYFGG